MFPDEPTSALGDAVTFIVDAFIVVVPAPEIAPLTLIVPEASVSWNTFPVAADDAFSATVAALSVRVTL